MTIVCRRCGTPLVRSVSLRNHWTAALSVSALVFYLPAMLLPMLRIEKLGHRHEDSLLSGLVALFSEGYWFVGIIILLFSVILPFVKLTALSVLSVRIFPSEHRHRALIYRSVEFLGRWGMLDVMLTAILVAFVKLGDMVNILAGSGLIAFAAMVLLSLLASFAFNPHLMWEKTG